MKRIIKLVLSLICIFGLVGCGDNSISEVISETFVEDFLSTLSDKDRPILELRMQGYTLQEVADKLGYRNHSGVLKRIRKIGQAYEKYANEDLGFSEPKIV